uniref:Calponin-homology (CH) domain-containing protein n=1 Tax=Globisporangium ultimum (strain ATCC 200006 / CBS 805.95 / DAOM BR144) TaxID=431595 RepID=K3WMP1_GLOUD
MTQRGLDARPLSPLTTSASTNSVAFPRQLGPILQKRPSTSTPPVVPPHSESVAVAGIHNMQQAFDPLVSPNHHHQQQKQYPAWAATHEQRSRTLAMFPVTRKQSAQRKFSITSKHGFDAKRTSIGSVTSTRPRKHSIVSIRGSMHPELNNDRESDEFESGDEDGNDADEMNYAHTMIHKLDVHRGETHYGNAMSPDMYEDGGKVYRGTVDRRGITPAVTFATTEMPPSQVKNPAFATAKGNHHHTTSCGFCSSTNIVWTLRCAFCGCSRMSDAPRLKYLIDMVLSVEPFIKPEKLAKKILDYAKFDRIAIKVETKFKQASLVRAKTAIMMMNRTINMLRQQMVRMIFVAWKGHNAIAAQHEAIMQRLIMIKDIQIKSNRKELAFAMWKGYVSRMIEERAQRFAIAAKRNEQTKLRRLWGFWQKFMRMRSKEKLEQMKSHYEAELNETPNEALREIEKLKETIDESRKLVFAATNTILELLHLSLRKADHDVLKTLQLRQMYPATVGHFFDSVHGQEILDALSSGHVASSSDDFGIDNEKDDEAMARSLESAKVRVQKMHPSENLMQWLNFQRKRSAEVGNASLPSTPSPAAPNGIGSSISFSSPGSGQRTSVAPSRLSVKSVRPTREKKKEFKEIKGLQDLRTSIANPGVMLKLLCHTSMEAQTEHQRIRASEAASLTSTSVAASESSTTATNLSPAAQVQLKIYFKMVHRILELPPDVVSRDSFALSDFDSLYAYMVYLYLFHPNYVAPGIALSPRYHLSYNFFIPQWEKVKNILTDDDFDSFAQQQYYIFLAKIKRVNRQFLRFGDICKSVTQIAHWHQQAVTRETFNDFTRRVLGKDSNISVALEKETLASWVALPASKLLGLCENEDELRAIERVFKDNVLDLIKIFRIYGSAAGGKGILEQEFLKIMTKAGVTDKKNILRSHLQIIYQQSRQSSSSTTSTSTIPSSSSSSDGNGGAAATGASSSAALAPSSGAAAGGVNNSGGDNDDEPEDRGATPNEFFEALTRVAHHNYQKRRDMLGQIAVAMNMAPGSAEFTSAAVPGLSLLAFVTELVVDKVVPLTKKFQEQGLTFKKQMIHPDVQHVCKAQEKKLKRIFTVYSQKNKNPGSRGKLMDLSDFEGLLKDRRLVDALFPYGRIKQLVSFVQQDGDMSGAAGINGYDTESEFVFSEFVEALAAIAVYRNANPYLPLAKKLETFFDENF